MKKFYLFYIDTDPGYERLKQAFRTVLSVGVSVLLIYWWVGGAGPLLAGFSAGTFSICIEGRNRYQQMVSMVIAGLTIMSTVCLGTALTHHTLIYSFLFVIACFLAFYVREKYGSRYIAFPISSLLLMMMSFNIPYEFEIFIYPVVVLTGFLTAFVIHFYILPENIELQFKHNFEIFLHKYSIIVSLLSTGTENSLSQKYFNSNISAIDSLIQKIKNERVLTKGMSLNIDKQKKMKRNIINQYELFKLLSMLNESLLFLSGENVNVKIRTEINGVFKELSNAVDLLALSYYEKRSSLSFNKFNDRLLLLNSEMRNLLSNTNTVTVHLSNLIFGLQMTSKLLMKQLIIIGVKRENKK